MKTNVANSSLAAYDELQQGRMAECKQKIINSMSHGMLYSRRQIAQITGLEVSCVAGRVNELLNVDKLLEVVGTIQCPITRRRVEAIALAPQQMELVA